MTRPTLFLLAHAGGSAAVYQHAFKGLAEHFILIPLELAGHGRRINEDLSDHLENLLADLKGQAARPLAAGPGYVIFGHSLGGLLGFLLAQALAAGPWGPPEHLIVSSACVPGQHRIKPGLLKLSDADLWRASAEYFGALHQEALDSEELRLLFTPILRADLTAVENYRPPDLAPLNAALTAVYAENDIVGPEDMARWAALTTRPLSLKKLPGGHFHPLTAPAAIEELILKIRHRSL